MTTLNDASVALETKLAALPGLSAAAVAWPGISYTPPTSGAWYKPALIPTETLKAAGAGASTHPRGAFQISIFRKPGPGAMRSLHTDAEALLSHFDRKALTATVHTGVPEIGPPLQEPDWLQLPVTVPFLCL